MAILFKFTELDRWWLWLIVILVLLVKAGYQPGVIVLGVIILLFKVFGKI